MFAAPPPSHLTTPGHVIVYDPPALISTCQNVALAVDGKLVNETVILPFAIILNTPAAARSHDAVPPAFIVPLSENSTGMLKYVKPWPLIGA